MNPAWVEAMKNEIEALEKNHTWELTEIPIRKKPIGCKWVCKVKWKAYGTMEKFKARLVAKNQVEGIDYHASFSPIAKVVTIKVLFAIAATKSLASSSSRY